MATVARGKRMNDLDPHFEFDKSIDAHQERVIGFDACGRPCFEQNFSVGGLLNEIAKAGGLYGEGDIGHARAKMLQRAVRDYAMSRVLVPGPYIAKWVMATTDEGPKDVTDLVNKGEGAYDFIRFVHVPVPPKKKWWRFRR